MIEKDINVMIGSRKFLDDMADSLDFWAAESIKGGWSTHQVEANKRAADQCRKEASKIRQLIEEQRP